MKKIIEELKKQKEIANKDLDQVNPEYRTSAKAAKSVASGKIKELEDEFRLQALKTATVILVYGKEAKAFADTMHHIDPIFSPISAFSIAEKIADMIDPRLYSKNVSASKILDVMSNVIEGEFLALGIREYNQPVYKTSLEGTIKNKKDVVDLANKVLTTQIGMESIGIFAARQVANQALKDFFEGESLPVVVYYNELSAEQLKKDLKKLNGNLFVVAAGKTSDEKNADIAVDSADEDSVFLAIETIVSKVNNRKAK